MADAGPQGAVVGSTSGSGPVAPPPDVGAENSFDVHEARKIANAYLSEGAEPPPAEGSNPSAADPAAEPKPEPAKAAEGSEDELTKEWVRFRNQDKRLKLKAQEFTAERAKHTEERAAFEAERAAHKAEVEAAKKHPLAALQRIGWSFDDLMAYVSKSGQIPQERILNEFKMQVDEELKTTREQLEEIKKEKASAERGKLIQTYEDAVTNEVKTTLDGYPNLKRFVGKFGVDKLLPKVFQQLHNCALQKNFLPPSKVLANFEEELSLVAPIFGSSPGQAGADSGSAQPEAVKPQPRPSPLTNDDVSERASNSADDDDDIETLRRKARAILAGG